MIHPEVQKVLDLPDTPGKSAAMEIVQWMRLDKVEEVMAVPRVISMTAIIDKHLQQYLSRPAPAPVIPETLPVASVCPNCRKAPVWRNTNGEFVLCHDYRDDKWCPPRFGGVFTGKTAEEAIKKWNERTIAPR